MKPVVHRYYLPTILKNRREVDSWSVWLVDENTGTLCIFGDRGNWTHTWGHSGRAKCNAHDFRLELLRFGSDYISDKLTYGQKPVLNPEKSVEGMREHILQVRRENSRRLTREMAREAWDALNGVDNETDWFEFIRDHDRHGGEWWDFGVYEAYEQSWLDHLMRVTLPRFKDAVRCQLLQEASCRQFRRAA